MPCGGIKTIWKLITNALSLLIYQPVRSITRNLHSTLMHHYNSPCYSTTNNKTDIGAHPKIGAKTLIDHKHREMVDNLVVSPRKTQMTDALVPKVAYTNQWISSKGTIIIAIGGGTKHMIVEMLGGPTKQLSTKWTNSPHDDRPIPPTYASNDCYAPKFFSFTYICQDIAVWS